MALSFVILRKCFVNMCVLSAIVHNAQTLKMCKVFQKQGIIVLKSTSIFEKYVVFFTTV